jgi:hypothetical protein
MKTRTKKMLATVAAKAAEFKEQDIRIDDNWRVFRADQLNWELRYKGRFAGYYGSLVSAFKALPDKMLGSAAKNSLVKLIETQNAIGESIEEAFSLLEHRLTPEDRRRHNISGKVLP